MKDNPNGPSSSETLSDGLGGLLSKDEQLTLLRKIDGFSDDENLSELMCDFGFRFTMTLKTDLEFAATFFDVIRSLSQRTSLAILLQGYASAVSGSVEGAKDGLNLLELGKQICTEPLISPDVAENLLSSDSGCDTVEDCVPDIMESITEGELTD